MGRFYSGRKAIQFLSVRLKAQATSLLNQTAGFQFLSVRLKGGDLRMDGDKVLFQFLSVRLKDPTMHIHLECLQISIPLDAIKRQFNYK